MTRPVSTYLRAWWRLNEASGTRYDSHGLAGSHHLTDYNTVAQGNGRYYDFDNRGANFVAANEELLYINDPLGLDGGDYDFSFGVWIRPHNVVPVSTYIFYGKWDASYGEYRLNIDYDSYATLVVYGNSGSYTVLATNFGALAANTWYFIGGYYDATTDKIGIGVNDIWNEATGPPGGIDSRTTAFYLGGYGAIGFAHYDGEMDDAFIYKGGTRHTAAEWTWMYNNGIGRRYEDAMGQSSPYVYVRTEPKIPEIYVYDPSLDYLGMIENYSSLNWAERYNSEGDFELEVPLGYASNSLLDLGNFLYIPTSDKLMVVEERKPTRGPAEGRMLVNGRSVESVLRRRKLTTLNTFNGGSAEFYMYTRVYWSVVTPSDSDREISLFEDGSGDPWPPAMESTGEIFEQYDEENIYEVIESIAKVRALGFKIVVADLTDTSSKLYFIVYEGVDRSESVIFSEEFNNLLDSSFLITEKGTINTVQVRTEDSVFGQVFVWMGGNSVSGGGTEPMGIGRYEGRLDTTVERGGEPSNVSETTPTTPTLGIVGKVTLAAIGITAPVTTKTTDKESPVPLTDSEVLAIIQTRGESMIKENVPLAVFDGDVDSRGEFTLGIDYFLGDIVQVNAHGINNNARIIEIVKSYTIEGEKFYLTFDFEV